MDTQININNREWRPIKGFEGLYDLRSDGLLYSHPRATTKGGYSYGNTVGKGYLHFALSKDGKVSSKRANRLVYEVFVGKIPKGFDVHHINGNPKDNRVENLELIESAAHSRKHLEENPDKMIKATQKPILQFTLDGEFVAEYPSVSEAARENNIYPSNISKCLIGKRKSAGGSIWKYKEAS